MQNIISWLFEPNIAYATSTDPWGGTDFATNVLTNMTSAVGLFSTPVNLVISMLAVCAVFAVIIRSIVHH